MFDLTTLNGTNGFRVEGENAGDRLGRYVSTAGDINGDGRGDLVLGAYYASPEGRNQTGIAYVIFGQVSGWPASFNLTTLDGSNGFRIEGLNAYDRLGAPVTSAGDINGDGQYDLVLGTPSADPDGRQTAGMVYVIFGQANGWPASFDLTTLNGTNGFLVEGLTANDNLGGTSRTAGDINGDGLSDLLLAAYLASPDGRTQAGMAYVIFGQASEWPASFNLTTLDGSNGFWVEGVNAYDYLGVSLNIADDINGDGRSEIMLGAYGVDADGRSLAGTVYVIFGQTGEWPASFNLATLNGSNGFRVEGLTAEDRLGRSVGTAGDINGDRISDLMLGAWQASPGGRTQAGTAYVIFGGASSWPASFNLTTLNGSNGFRVEGVNTYDWLTYSTSIIGDMNDDGLSDIVLGAPSATPGGRDGAGVAYVILGRVSGWPASFNLLTLSGSNGFRVEGVSIEDALGLSVSTAGDMNGDGKSDLALGAYGASSSGRNLTGTAYVLFGPAAITPNRPPQLSHPLPNQMAKFGIPFTFQIASDTFSDPDGDTLTYFAAQSGGQVLPSWLTFDSVEGFFGGTPNQTSITPITVTATDPYGLTASTGFNIDVQNPVNNTAWIIGGIVGGIAAIGGGLAGAAYLAYKKGFFALSGRDKKTLSASPDAEIELTKKTGISLAG